MIRSLSQRERWVLWGLFGLAAALRVQQWVFARSFWADEAKLALNIRDHTFSQLISSLDSNQGAPIGFLWLQKAIVSIFSDHEMVFRFLPLLIGILSVWVFTRLAFACSSKSGAWIATIFFVTSEALIYYSNENKQYIFDVFWLLVLFSLAVRLHEAEEKTRALFLLGLLGCLALWMSHAAVLVCAALGVALCFARLRGHLSVSWLSLGLLAGAWLASFLPLLFLSLKPLMANERLHEYWQYGFMPWSPGEALVWLGDSIRALYERPGSLVPGVALPLSLWGVYVMVKKRDQILHLVGWSTLITLLAAALHEYPFTDRLILFLVPGIMLITAIGLGDLADRSIRRFRKRRSLALMVVGLFVVAASSDSLEDTADRVRRPLAIEHIRPLLEHAQRQWRPGDRLYIHRNSWSPFRYYRERLSWRGDWSLGRGYHEEPARFDQDIDALEGSRRVWVLLSHTRWEEPLLGHETENDYVLARFAERGRLLEMEEINGTVLALFEFRGG